DDVCLRTSRIQYASHQLEAMRQTHGAFENALKHLQEAEIQIEEACNDLRHFADTFEADPERLQQIEERLSDIFQLARKHRTSPGELIQLQQSLSQQLESLSGGEQK